MPGHAIHPVKLTHRESYCGGDLKDSEVTDCKLGDYEPSFSQKELDSSVQTIKASFLKFSGHHDKAKTAQLEICKFHVALSLNSTFVMNLLPRLTAEEVQFAFTAIVTQLIQNPATDLHSDGTDLDRMKKKLFDENSGQCHQKIFELPLVFIAYGGNAELLPIALKQGACIEQTDSKGNNIVHYLVDISEENPSRAVSMLQIILKLESEETQRRLVQHVTTMD